MDQQGELKKNRQPPHSEPPACAASNWFSFVWTPCSLIFNIKSYPQASLFSIYTKHAAHLCPECLHVMRLGLNTGEEMAKTLPTQDLQTICVQKNISLLFEGRGAGPHRDELVLLPSWQIISRKYQQQWSNLPWKAAFSPHLCLVSQDRAAAQLARLFYGPWKVTGTPQCFLPLRCLLLM